MILTTIIALLTGFVLGSAFTGRRWGLSPGQGHCGECGRQRIVGPCAICRQPWGK